MPGRRLTPEMPLAAFVECLWYWEGAPGPHAQERLLPQAQATIILNLRDDPIALHEDRAGAGVYGTAAFSGARSNCFTIDCHQQERVAGVQFRPGGAFPFFPMPISEMENASFNMLDLWGADAALLREQVLAAPTPLAMLHTLARCLEGRLHSFGGRRTGHLHPAIAYMARELDRSHSTARVATVAGRIGLSQRRLTQLFHEQVGVSPKTFHRVRRFQHTLVRLRGLHQVDWAEVALDSGYYDQAHLAHDFREIAGMTPGSYLAAATEHMNHVPLRD